MTVFLNNNMIDKRGICYYKDYCKLVYCKKNIFFNPPFCCWEWGITRIEVFQKKKKTGRVLKSFGEVFVFRVFRPKGCCYFNE